MNKILNKAIKRAGSQSKLAEYLKTHRQFVNQWVKDKRPIPDAMLAKIKELIT